MRQYLHKSQAVFSLWYKICKIMLGRFAVGNHFDNHLGKVWTKFWQICTIPFKETWAVLHLPKSQKKHWC